MSQNKHHDDMFDWRDVPLSIGVCFVRKLHNKRDHFLLVSLIFIFSNAFPLLFTSSWGQTESLHRNLFIWSLIIYQNSSAVFRQLKEGEPGATVEPRGSRPSSTAASQRFQGLILSKSEVKTLSGGSMVAIINVMAVAQIETAFLHPSP